MRAFILALALVLVASAPARAQLLCPDGKLEKYTVIGASWAGTVTAGKVTAGFKVGYLDQPFQTWTPIASFPMGALKNRVVTYSAVEFDQTSASGDFWTTPLRYNGDGSGQTRGAPVSQLQAGIDYASDHFPDTDTGSGSLEFAKRGNGSQFAPVYQQYLQPAIDGGWPQWSVVLIPLYTRGVTLSGVATLTIPHLHAYSCAR